MAPKKKSKQVLNPWCWYCEREFEDEKVLMQHQKAKHFKCKHCPRRLNTAGGLAVHIQQVHKLEPDKIENALPGRDGGEVEIFGMEGIPKSDAEAWRRKKEAELGLASGSITATGTVQPVSKRPKYDTKPLSEADLAAQLAAHKARMGGGDEAPSTPTTSVAAGPSVVFAAPQTYAAAPTPAPPHPGFMPYPPPPGMMFPNGPPPGMPFPPGMPPPPGFPFAPGMMPPGFRPPFPPMPGQLPPPMNFPGGPPPIPPPGMNGPQFAPPPPQSHPMTPSSSTASVTNGTGSPARPASAKPQPQATPQKPAIVHVDSEAPTLSAQVNPALKAGTKLIWDDPMYSPEEKRSQNPQYAFTPKPVPDDLRQRTPSKLDNGSFSNLMTPESEPRGKKRARAEDFL